MTFSTEDEIPSHLQVPSVLHSSIWKVNAPYCHSLLICLQSSAHLMLGLLSMTDVLYRCKRVCVFAEFMNFFLTQCYQRYAFLDFSSADEANICLLTVHGSHFDKYHQLVVNCFTNIEKFTTLVRLTSSQLLKSTNQGHIVHSFVSFYLAN